MSQIFSYTSCDQPENQGNATKGGLDSITYLIDFTDGLRSGITLNSAATVAVDSSNATVTSSCISMTSVSGALATIVSKTCGSGGTGTAADNAQFRFRTTATISSGGPLVYDVFVLVSDATYDPGDL